MSKKNASKKSNGGEWLSVIASPLVSETLLFRGYGLRREDHEEFAALVAEISLGERPQLSYFFDSAYYLRRNPDVLASGVDPLLHFVEHGAMELRDPHPLISMRHLLGGVSLKAGEDAPISAMIERLNQNIANPSPYFDVPFYLDRQPAAKNFPEGALAHYLQDGCLAEVPPNAFFEPAWYCERYADVQKQGIAPISHFAERGDHQRRRPGRNFDPDWYVHAYPDVLESGAPPLFHFLGFGRFEGREPSNPRDRVSAPPTATAQQPSSGFDIAPIQGLAVFDRLKSLVHDRHRARVESFVERDIRPVSIANLEASGKDVFDVNFRVHRRVKVSIIIPCFNELPYTLECLHSIAEAAPAVPYEIIVADDASPDASVKKLASIDGIKYIRQASNVGFLRNCNAAFKEARGAYVFLLNNDAQILPGMLEALVAILDRDSSVGAAGPKILYPNGRLQEAGCFVNRDGTSGMIGLFDQPDLPVYSWPRAVNYCSGAGLLVRKAAVDGHLFDERFAPAYCEDLDLCLRIGAAGFKVAYEPAARLVHHLSVSMAKESQAKKLQQVVRNQQKLLEKWQSRLVEMSRVRVLAFYLPQFHPTAENDLWWGTGFTEWTNVSKSLPAYRGHYQPHLPADLGYYDLRVPETLENQALLARRYGIQGFCVYYYNFNGRRLLDKPLEVVLKNPKLPFEFCICWANENWSRRWDGGNQELLQEQSYDDETMSTIAVDITRFSADRRYIRVNGRPLVLIYRPMLIPDCALQMARLREATSECGPLYLVYVESMETIGKGIAPEDLGFDACVEFPPQGIAVPCHDQPVAPRDGWNGHRYNYEETVVNASNRNDNAFLRHPSAFPSWDNSPRQPSRGTSFEQVSPEAFQAYLEAKLDEVKSFSVGEERLLFVNAWNEWAEGAHLEPDQRYGHRWLESIRNALRSKGCD